MSCRGAGRYEGCPDCQRVGKVGCVKCSQTGQLPCKKCSQTGKVTCDNCIGYGEVNRVPMEVWTYNREVHGNVFGPEGTGLTGGDFRRKNAIAFPPEGAKAGFFERHKDPDGNVIKALSDLEHYIDKPRGGLVKEDYMVRALPITCCEMQHGSSKFRIWGLGGPAGCRVVPQDVPERTGMIKMRKAAPFIAGLTFAVVWVLLLYFL